MAASPLSVMQVLVACATSRSFASQGAGRVVWPLVAGFMRLVLAAVGGSLAIHWLGGGPRALSFVIALAFVLFGVTLLSAVKGGGWRSRGR